MGYSEMLNELAQICHKANEHWYRDLDTGTPLKRNVPELLMLCVSELAEALEGHRKNLQDEHLPHRKMFDVELADCLIRIFDLCGAESVDIGSALVEKMAYNAIRAGHRPENRRLPGGKAY